ncbi:peptide chain release factor N(5)-glutamine methyltransferase [Celeribacter arenosi]|uniref:Release factor glutamine methyltransferase n=1 Tax=Celeribacter arenosi TaxID=792649 RepID=A0ABP7KF62_9RHOB
MNSVRDVLVTATKTLAGAGIEGAGRDARLLMSHALDIAPDRLTLVLPDPMPEEAAERFATSLDRRLSRVPVSHILGRRSFYGRDFIVSGDVLDPRPETETLVIEALAKPFTAVLDLGTGSGAILLTLLAEQPLAKGLGTDTSEAALAVARSNAEHIGVGSRARWLRADWFEGVEGTFDLIVSNPPYIAADEMDALSPELAHEPRGALTDEADGLSAFRTIISQARGFLGPRGRLIVEIGPTQGSAVADMMLAAGFKAVRVLSDLDGRDRVVRAQLPNPHPRNVGK